MSSNTEDGVRKTDNRDTMEFRHEVVIPNEDLPFKMFIFEGKDGNYKVSTHWHQSVEIFLVTEGTIDFYIDSHYFSLKEHQFVIVNSNQVHSIDCPYSNNTIVLQIPVETFQLYHRETPYISFIPQSQEKNRELAALVEQMYATYDAKEYGYELKVRSQFYELLYLLLTSFREENLYERTLPGRNFFRGCSQPFWIFFHVFVPDFCPVYSGELPDLSDRSPGQWGGA